MGYFLTQTESLNLIVQSAVGPARKRTARDPLNPCRNPPFARLERAPAGGKKNCLHFSICACHPCAGAMLIFSVSFQF